MPRLLIAALMLTLVACVGRPPANPDAPPPVQIERLQRQFPFSRGPVRITVSNRYGDIRLRPEDGRNRLGLMAVVQRIGTKPREPHFEIQHGEDSFALRIRFDQDRDNAMIDTRQGRVDLVVFVPRDADLDLETTSGIIKLRRAAGAVRARSSSGNIQVSSTGPVDLATDSGHLSVRLLDSGKNQARRGASVIRSGTGLIDLGIPTRGELLLMVHAEGGVSLESGWKPGEIEVPEPASRRFDFQRGQPAADRTIRVESAGPVVLSPVIELN